jgi:hypothetical protein
MKKYILTMLFMAAFTLNMTAQDTASNNQQDVVVCKSFWNGWFVEAGLDMTLHNPYGHNFSKVIPKGTSF